VNGTVGLAIVPLGRLIGALGFTFKLVSLSPDFNFVASGLNGAGWVTSTERGIQIDSATRTGWTYGPGDQQVQQFSY
jgi:hypothetical protein